MHPRLSNIGLIKVNASDDYTKDEDGSYGRTGIRLETYSDFALVKTEQI